MTACSCHALGPFWYSAGLARVDEVRNFINSLPLFALARGPSRVLPSAVGTQRRRQDFKISSVLNRGWDQGYQVWCSVCQVWLEECRDMLGLPARPGPGNKWKQCRHVPTLPSRISLSKIFELQLLDDEKLQHSCASLRASRGKFQREGTSKDFAYRMCTSWTIVLSLLCVTASPCFGMSV